jgi:hypothetical protein
MRRAVDGEDWEAGMRRLLTLSTAVVLVVSAGVGVTNAAHGG